MAGIDDRVVSMSFESSKFQTGVATTLESLQKLNDSLKKVGTTNGLENIEKSASKISFSGLSSAIDKIKGKFTFREADQGFSEIDKAANKVTLTGVGTAVDKLKGKFNFPEADTGFSQIERASGKVTFTGLTQALDGLGNKFGVLEGAASVALGNIATRASMAGGALVKSLTFEPVTGGFHEYETQLNAVQTILSNTAASGAKLKDVNKALNELNHYADKTIYNFTEMAKNIGTFTAAGVDLNTATASIKGIANLAALSGSNSQQASTAMYQLSQAISSGRVSLQDWNSVVNAGMGGTVFQRALAQTAEQMGTIKKGAVELKGPMKNVTISGKSFRESITAKPGEQSWLTSKVLTSTLKQLSGDMTDAQLKAEGFSAAQIKNIQAQAKMAVNAATQVKTLSGLLDTTKEAVGSGWAQTWQIVFGDFGQAKTLFTGLSNAIGGMVQDSSNARNAMLKDWAALGGRKALLEGLKNVFIDLRAVVRPIKEAFRDIFPPKTGADLAHLTKSFRDFTETLKIGPETAENLRRSFRGFFAVLDIGKQIVGGMFTVLGKMFGAAGDGSGGFLKLTGTIGDLLVALDHSIKTGTGFTKFFEGLGTILAAPIKLFGRLTGAIAGLFGGAKTDASSGLSSSLSGLGKNLNPMVAALDRAKDAWDGFLDVLKKARGAIGPLISDIAGAFGGFGDAVAQAFQDADYGKVFNVIQTGLIAGIFLVIKKALSGGLKIDVGGGLLSKVSETFDTLTTSMKTMQTNVKADTLLKIGAALALLAAGVVALSFIDPKRLASAMTATAVGLGQLVGAMAVLTKIGGTAAFVTMPLIAGSLILLAAAVDTLALAVVIFSKLSWEELAKGLVGVGGALVAIGIGTKLIGPSITLAGPGVLAVAIAMNVLAGAMKIFATMKWEDIGKGLAGIAGGLIAIGIGTKLMGPSLILVGPGLIAVGVALGLLAGATLAFGKMDLKTIGKGLLGIGGSLLVIGLAISAIPPTVALQAAGLILVGIALTGIAGAIRLFSGMSIEKMAKGIGAIGASLLVLAGGLTLMSGTLPGAAALLVAASALTLLIPVLGILGNMKWSTIGKGLAVIAATLLVIGAAGIVAGPGLIAIGLGLTAIGAGVALVGLGIKVIVDALVKLGSDGAKGIALLLASFTAMVAVFPKIVIDFVKGIVQIISSVAALAPQIAVAVVKIVESLAGMVVQVAPQLSAAFLALMTAGLTAIRTLVPDFIKTGLVVLNALLTGIKNNIGRVTSQVGDIVVNFLRALTGKLPQLTAAGLTALVSLLKGISGNLAQVTKAATTVVASFISGIAAGTTKVVAAIATLMVKLIAGIASTAGKMIAAGAGIVGKIVEGIASGAGRLVNSAVTAAGRFINALAKALLRLVDTGARAIISFMNGIATAINKYEPQMIAAGARIGAAIVRGMITGIGQLAGEVLSKIGRLASDVASKAKGVLKINSPSKVFHDIGYGVVEGFSNGLLANPDALAAVSKVSHDVVSRAKSILGVNQSAAAKVMVDLGQQLVGSFTTGILGSTDDMNSAFTDLDNKVKDSMTSLLGTISTENDHLKELQKAKKPDLDAISKAKDAIAANKAALDSLSSAHKTLTADLEANKKTMSGYAKDYQDIADKLELANTALDDAKKARDDAVKSFSDQYSTLPALNPDDGANQLYVYTQSLQNQATAVASYQSTLEQLRKLGLDDATYQKLLSEGTADQAFASQILAGGKTAVDGLNALDAQLARVSSGLATQAANNLYKAGVDAAHGLVKGLTSQQSELRTTMETLAATMVAAIKKKLKIKSPSKAFEEIGKFSVQGMAQGLTGSSNIISSAAERVGEDALSAMQKSMGHISTVLSAEIDSNPTITPVLDLTQIQQDAKKLSDLTNVVPITAAASYGVASAISASQPGQTAADALAANQVPVFNFEQNNYSPEALADIEIYRQTNNQLSLAKSALGL